MIKKVQMELMYKLIGCKIGLGSKVHFSVVNQNWPNFLISEKSESYLNKNKFTGSRFLMQHL